MKRKTKWKLGAAAIFVALAILLPEVVSAGWHVVHGRSVDYRGWKVTVPFEWYAMRHGDGMTVERMSRLSWEKDPVATFLPVHFTKTFPFNYEVFGGVQAKVLRGKGYAPAAVRNIQIGANGGRCWTFTSTAKGQSDQEWIDCVVPKDLTSVDYIGPTAYANEFFSVIGSIQPVTSAR